MRRAAIEAAYQGQIAAKTAQCRAYDRHGIGMKPVQNELPQARRFVDTAFGQSRRDAVRHKLHVKAEYGFVQIRHAHDAQPAYPDQPGESGGGAGRASFQADPVISDKREAGIDQTKQKRGFATAGRTAQQNARPLQRSAGGVDRSRGCKGAVSGKRRCAVRYLCVMTQRMHDHSPSSLRPVLQDSVTYYGVTGLGPDGTPPESLIEECQNALAKIREILATHGLVPEDITHLAYMIPDSTVFSTCQRIIAEALGPARPAMTLRLKPSFDVPGQRLEFNFIASA